MLVRGATGSDVEAILAFLEHRGSARVTRRGELVDATAHPALVAEVDGVVCGLLTYVVDGAECEVLTLHADPPHTGLGSQLVEAVARLAVERDCDRLWLVTTNDNVDALRFYQRRGFALVTVRPGAVDQARIDLKPEIPDVAANGIPIRDELELERLLRQSGPPG